MIVKNGAVRDTVATEMEGRCEICLKHSLPFLKRCFEHSMPQDIAKALDECNTSLVLNQFANESLKAQLATAVAKIADYTRNVWLYRAGGVLAGFILVLAAAFVGSLNWR